MYITEVLYNECNFTRHYKTLYCSQFLRKMLDIQLTKLVRVDALHICQNKYGLYGLFSHVFVKALPWNFGPKTRNMTRLIHRNHLYQLKKIQRNSYQSTFSTMLITIKIKKVTHLYQDQDVKQISNMNLAMSIPDKITRLYHHHHHYTK